MEMRSRLISHANAFFDPLLFMLVLSPRFFFLIFFNFLLSIIFYFLLSWVGTEIKSRS
jgi:hypothetical protein